VSGMSRGSKLLALAALLALVACSPAKQENASWRVKPVVPPGTDLEMVFHHNNLGVAHLERHHYQEAAKEFEKVVASLPGWADGHVNDGVALLSLHENDGASREFRKALEIAPRHPHAHYGLGLLLKQGGSSQAAMEEFRKVLEVDPEDPDTLYNLGLLQAREGKHAEAVAALRKALASQPANVSARFRLASSLLAMGDKEAGEKEMALFKQMSGTGAGLSMGLQYSEQGKYSLAITDYASFGVPAPAKKELSVRFVAVPPSESGLATPRGGGGEGPRSPAPGLPEADAVCTFGPGAAVADIDSDGDMDLFVPGCGAGKGGAASLWRNDGSGKFTESAATASLEGARGAAAAFGDYDNDGHPDLAVSGADGVKLYRNLGGGKYADVTASAGVAGGGSSLGMAWADADHDGDLDLIVARPGTATGKGWGSAPLLFFNNDGNGKFREVAGEKQVKRPLSALAVTFSDLDDDRDVDFLVSVLAGRVRVFSNDRIGTFTEMPESYAPSAVGSGEGATLADLDGDGWQDLYLPRTGWFRNREGKGFELQKGVPAIPEALGSTAFDYDDDMDLDLFVAGKQLRLFRNEGSGRFSEATAEAGLEGVEAAGSRAVVAADWDSDGDPDLILTRNGAPPLLLRNDGGNLGSWLRLKLVGLHSNREGVGAKVETHTGSRFQRREIRLGGGYLSQEPASPLFGLGALEQIDFVRLLWPGGVLQSELEVPVRNGVEISELDRKGSSCPLLFAWDGGKIRFITDFLGTGGLGFLVRPGVYAPPDPDEYIKIEAKQLAARDGYYVVQVLENLEEVSYLDKAQLWVVDHPADEAVFPNERFGGSGPPAYELFEFKKPILPERATDDSGMDVLRTLTGIDRTYPDRFKVEERLPGYAETHTLTFDFGSALKGKDDLVLFLYGWVDYGYSSSNLAAHQAGIELLSPWLEAVGEDGEWHTLIEDMGYPAGLPRMMTVDLRRLGPFEDGRFRITTNLRVYWDQIFMAQVEKASSAKITKLPASHADLHTRGYPREHSPDGKKPLIYDYGIMDRTFQFRNLAGAYTRLGQITDLLTEADDRFVIFGRGEEVTLKFKADRLPHLPKGWKRDFLFYSNGYCKDMDPNTAFPDTVEPLPFHGMSAYPYPEGEQYPQDPSHLEYLRVYNTRRIGGSP
jgi:Tfp pilus assembly protein PilF